MSICWHSPVNEGIPIFMGTSFCPSCHQKRVVEFGERLCMDVLKKVPHRHFVLGIPKILRRYFLYDRRLLADPRLRGDKPEPLRLGIPEGLSPGGSGDTLLQGVP